MRAGSRVRERLAEAGKHLPPAPVPLGGYVPALCAGDLVFVSGQLPLVGKEPLARGFVGADVSLELARACAEQAALNALAAASTVCDLDEVTLVVRLAGYVASAPGFTDHTWVVDAASSLLVEAFGDCGRHTRVAVGVAVLPLCVPVELELILHV